MPVKIATAPSSGAARARIRTWGSIGWGESREASATCGRRYEGDFGLVGDGCLPARVLLLDGAAEVRPHAGETGMVAHQMVEYGGHGAALSDFEGDPGDAHDLPRTREEQDGYLQAGTRSRDTMAASGRLLPSLAVRMGAATSQYFRQSHSYMKPRENAAMNVPTGGAGQPRGGGLAPRRRRERRPSGSR